MHSFKKCSVSYLLSFCSSLCQTTIIEILIFPQVSHCHPSSGLISSALPSGDFGLPACCDSFGFACLFTKDCLFYHLPAPGSHVCTWILLSTTTDQWWQFVCSFAVHPGRLGSIKYVWSLLYNFSNTAHSQLIYTRFSEQTPEQIYC